MWQRWYVSTQANWKFVCNNEEYAEILRVEAEKAENEKKVKNEKE